MGERHCSASYHRYWGKANEDSPCHLLAWHSLDVAAVGSVLLEQQPALLARMAKDFHLSPARCKILIVFLLGLHDIGKFAESFQYLRSDLRSHFYPGLVVECDEYTIRHDQLGWVLWKEKLAKYFQQQGLHDDVDGVALQSFNIWMKAVTGHHGTPPDTSGGRPKQHFASEDMDAAQLFFDDWLKLQSPPFDAIVQAHTPRGDLAAVASTWPLAGFAVLCDWLGSQEEVFEFCDEPMPLFCYWEEFALPRARDVVLQSGLSPAVCSPLKNIKALFSYIDSPTPLQKTCSEVPLGTGPQLFILEDVTGAGKTEAAVMLVHRLLNQGAGDGVYIGLPTMATANAMYERMSTAYRGLFDESTQPSLILSHGARHLSELFRESLFDNQGAAANYGREESVTAQCNRWLADNRKKALLADVGVGTIDQALLAVMPAKHQSLRLLGLYGKVLVLDEVHAYDFYTRELLHNLLAFHSRMGGCAILLSATLTAEQKSQLAGAFSGNSNVLLAQQCRTDYPLITHIDSNEANQIPVETRASVARHVTVDLVHCVQAVFELVREALASGQCVCWVRNTVADVRDAYRQINEGEWVDENRLHMFHSRFAMGDRLAIESEMLDLFGKNSGPEQRRGRLLVASQVVEQSLDLDFDLMVSDLAPVDLLIQRAGRLQRHERDATGALSDSESRGGARLVVYSPELTAQPESNWYKEFLPGGHAVYPHTLVLWRTAKWLAKSAGWQMPNDARDMLEYVYANDGEVPAGLEDSLLEREGERMSQRDLGKFSSLVFTDGYVRNQTWDSEARVETRLGDESRTVYLARWEDEQLRPWISEGSYPWDMSSVRVRAALIKQSTAGKNIALDTKLNQLLQSEERFDEDTVVLPMVELESGSWTCAGVEADDKPVVVTYEPTTGIDIVKNT